MTDKKGKNGLPDLGVPLPMFKAAVETLVRLCDEGKFLVFLGRGTYVKLIGDPTDFQSLFREVTGKEIAGEHTNEVLAEIRNYCSSWAGTRDATSLVSFLENVVYDDAFKTHKEQKAELKKQLEAKVNLVSEKLYTTPMRQRAIRLETATGPCLQDVDVELVQQRRDNVQSQNVDEPFLRLRLRYSKRGEFSPWMPPFYYSTWMEATGLPMLGAETFEIEGDESDIDLLITRLIAAKKLLIKSAEMAADKSPT